MYMYNIYIYYIYNIYRTLQNSIPWLRVLCSVPRYSTVLSGELNFHPLRLRCQRSGRISRAQTFTRQPIADYYLVVDRSRTRSLHFLPSAILRCNSSLPFHHASYLIRLPVWEIFNSTRIERLLNSRVIYHQIFYVFIISVTHERSHIYLPMIRYT